jgi:hypothetical protein
MKIFFNLGVMLVFVFIGLCWYWYLYPHKAPGFLRGQGPAVDWPQATNPVSNFPSPKY